jgi:hypothetical protein
VSCIHARLLYTLNPFRTACTRLPRCVGERHHCLHEANGEQKVQTSVAVCMGCYTLPTKRGKRAQAGQQAYLV